MFLRVGGICFVILLGFWLYCLLDAITADRTRVRHLPKPAWILIVLLLLEAGAVAWLVAGRPRGETAQGSRDRRPGRARPAPPRQLPPDDDAEFLAQLERRQDEDRRRDDDRHRTLDRWETELRRREEKRRGQEGDKSGPEDQLR